MFKPAAALANNAMLHKDLTQWLRNKTFGVLFFGLILIAEAISIIFGMLPMDRGTGGPASFGFLSMIIYIYAFIIAFSGYGITMREFQNRTFELYELSGMSLEKMIRGKFFSLAVQFCFGFFCVVPFMFFAYLLGGVDFYLILATILGLALMVPPLYLFALAVSLHGKQFRGAGALIRIAAGLFSVYFIIGFINMLFFVRYGRSPMAGPVDLVKNLIQLDPDTLIGAAVFMGFYIQVCALLFYLSCNAVAPATDTRESQVKFFASTLTLSLMGMALWPLVKSGNDRSLYLLMIAFTLIGLTGLIYFWSPLVPPLMARKRQAAARWPIGRMFHYGFQPGPWGTFRIVLLYWLASWAIVLFYGSFSTLMARRFSFSSDTNQLISLPLALPFFIAFPACFITRFRSLRTRGAAGAMRLIIILYWAISGAILAVAALILNDTYRNLYGSAGEVVSFLCLVASPVSAMISLGFRNSGVIENSPQIWAVLGVIGVILMARTIRGRARAIQARQEDAIRAAAAAKASAGQTAQGPGTGWAERQSGSQHGSLQGSSVAPPLPPGAENGTEGSPRPGQWRARNKQGT